MSQIKQAVASRLSVGLVLVAQLLAAQASAEDLVVPLGKGGKGGLDLKAGIAEREQALALQSLGLGIKYEGMAGSLSVDEAGALSVAGERSFKLDETTLTGRLKTGPTGPSIGFDLKIPFRLDVR